MCHGLLIESVKLTTVLDELKFQFSDTMGPREKALNEYLQFINAVYLQFINAVCEAYHGHVLVGNMCVKVLHNYLDICAFMDGSSMKENIAHLFRIFSELQPLLYANHFLTDAEIQDVSKLCDEIWYLLPKVLN